MATQINISSNDKNVQVIVETKSNIKLETSRSVSYSGVQKIIPGNNIQVTPSNGVGNVTIELTGTVANANYANYSGTSFNVAGPNVSGIVANANYSAYAGNVNQSNTVTNSNQPNITQVGTLVNLISAGNITAPYFIGNVLGNITGNIVVPGTQWDVLFNNLGNAGASDNLRFDSSSNILTVVGNVDAAYISGDAYKLSNIAGGNVTGAVAYATTANNVAGGNVSGQVGNSLIAGTVYTNSQPNITSVGTLTSLDVSGNIAGNVISATQFRAGNTGSESTGYTFTGEIGQDTGMYSDSQGQITLYNNSIETLYLHGNNEAEFTNTLTTKAILPKTDVTYNIGSPTQRYKDLYLSNATIYMGTVQLSATTDAFTLPNANVTTDLIVGGNSTIAGNLTVSGTTEYTNVNNLYIKDPLIEIGGAANSEPLTTNDGKDRGELLHYYTTQPVNAFMGWKNSNLEFQFGSNVSMSDNVITVNQLGNIRAQHIYANINGINVVGNVSDAVHSYNSDSANNVAGANVTGTVANATYAVNAGNAYNVNVSNVSGIGNIATLNLDGNAGNILFGNGVFSAAPDVSNANSANYANYANFAGTSYSVAGSNVTGTVANATYAITSGTSYSVAGSNVSGTVANATYAINAGNAYSVAGANVTGTVANATYAVSAGSATTADTVTNASQSNITSVGTLTSLTVTGNISTTNYFVGNGAYLTGLPASYGNSNVANYLPTFTGNLTAGNINGGNLVVANYVSGNGSLLTNLNGANISNVANANYSNYAGTSYSVAGANVTGTVANATYAVTSGTSYSVSGSNVSGQVGNALIAGTVYTNAQPNITSVGNLSSLTVDNGTYGNVVITQFATVFATGKGSNPRAIYQATAADGVAGIGMQAYSGINGQIYANTGITFTTGATLRDKDFPTGGTTRATIDSNGLAVTGNITSTNANLGNLVIANYSTAVLTTGAQPNITSVGSLTGLTSVGVIDFTNTSNVTLGTVGNLHISGGTSGYVLSTDGTGTLNWVAQSGGGGGGTPGGNTTELQFNNAGSFGGIANVRYASGNLTLGAVGNIKITGGSNNYIMTTDGAGNLSFTTKTNNLTIGTRSTSVNIPISNYTMNVEGRTGNITVNVN